MIIILHNAYINKKGKGNSENVFISKFKSLEKVYLTNNICESIHSHIAKFIENKKVTKSLFKDTLNYIINHYKYNLKKCIRRDYVTRTLIIIIEKLKLNDNPKFISYDIFKKELEYTISLMTGHIKINTVDEIINLIDYLDTEEREEKLINNDNILNKKEEDSLSFSYNSEDNYEEVLSFDNITIKVVLEPPSK